MEIGDEVGQEPKVDSSFDGPSFTTLYRRDAGAQPGLLIPGKPWGTIIKSCYKPTIRLILRCECSFELSPLIWDERKELHRRFLVTTCNIPSRRNR
jgi:hypothetical protein